MMATPVSPLVDAAWLEGLARLELANRSLQGFDLAGLSERLVAAKGDADAIWAVYQDALAAAIPAEYPFAEPNGLEEIRALRPSGPRVMDYDLSDLQLEDKVHGALLGRIIGVILGRPVEGATEADIRRRLESTGDYPLAGYFPRYWTENGERRENGAASLRSTREGLRMRAAAEADDDINYVLLNTKLLEKYGPNFSTTDVGYLWLESFPANWSWGPERTAYLNLARFTDYGERWRPIDFDTLWKVTHYLHESSELIGAQIRADAFGYAAPGLPELAAEWAWRDAALTHVKNGIYGEMLFAAIIAAAFTARGIREAVEVGLTEIPERCRLAEAVRNTLAWWDELADWRAVYERIAEHYNVYTPGGTINNACIIVNALLAGQGDFERTMTITVMQGQDTDCTAATAGSIIGAWLGASSVPEKWSAPLADTFYTAIPGEGPCSISAVAGRAYALGRTFGKSRRNLPFKWDM
ncbi:MAG TPA: ADP-ribosylglycohydrolase family protein [Armatimonadota bacterium]|jgi:ADP-ribosylglycohydrolase